MVKEKHNPNWVLVQTWAQNQSIEAKQRNYIHMNVQPIVKT